MDIFLKTAIKRTAAVLVLGAALNAAAATSALTHYRVSPAEGKIVVDGQLAEAAWQQAVVIDLPFEYLPGDNTPAPVRTECRITYSPSRLYIGFRCFDPHPRKIRAHLMDRDAIATFELDDHVAVTIDTFNDRRRAFLFLANPLGVQVDATYSEAEGKEDYSWDARWQAAAAVTDFGYSVEMAIPFRQLRFHGGQEVQTWGISLERSYPRTVRHRLCSHRRERNISCRLCQADKLSGFSGLSRGRNLELVPTLTLGRTDRRKEFSHGGLTTGELEAEAGLSAGWGISHDLTLNAAVNPDFSQVEADVAQLEVNTRFALRYPEKRPFFLEGADFFKTPFEVVFSRTVFDPRWGIKLTGKPGKNVLGLFAARDRVNNLLIPANQSSAAVELQESVFGGVLRFRRDVGKGSTLGLLYTGRAGEDYANRVVGLDGFFRLSKTRIANFQLLHSRTRYPGEIARDFNQQTGPFNGHALFLNFRHLGRHVYYGIDYEDISPGFRADYGFIPRVDLRQLGAFVEPVWWGKAGGWFNKLAIQVSGQRTTDTNGRLTDLSAGVDFKYFGPLQTRLASSYYFQQELYGGVTYDKHLFITFFDIRPASGMMLHLLTRLGDYVDYANSRLADRLYFESGIDLNLGRHLYVDLTGTFERLSLKGDTIYSARLLQLRWVYNLNVRTFFRIMGQYLDIDRNTALYTSETEPETRTFFAQVLFSYKINPQTVLFLGYSDNHQGGRGLDLTRQDRTFFLKIGYALGL